MEGPEWAFEAEGDAPGQTRSGGLVTGAHPGSRGSRQPTRPPGCALALGPRPGCTPRKSNRPTDLQLLPVPHRVEALDQWDAARLDQDDGGRPPAGAIAGGACSVCARHEEPRRPRGAKRAKAHAPRCSGAIACLMSPKSSSSVLSLLPRVAIAVPSNSWTTPAISGSVIVLFRPQRMARVSSSCRCVCWGSSPALRADQRLGSIPAPETRRA